MDVHIRLDPTFQSYFTSLTSENGRKRIESSEHLLKFLTEGAKKDSQVTSYCSIPFSFQGCLYGSASSYYFARFIPQQRYSLLCNILYLFARSLWLPFRFVWLICSAVKTSSGCVVVNSLPFLTDKGLTPRFGLQAVWIHAWNGVQSAVLVQSDWRKHLNTHKPKRHLNLYYDYCGHNWCSG